LERVRPLTCGFLKGIDPSRSMIAVAQKRGVDRVAWEVGQAETMDFDQAFDVVVANSSLQWFTDPRAALNNIYRALRPGGRFVAQSPATARGFCPLLHRATLAAAAHPVIGATFARFRSPWFLLDTEAEYHGLLTQARFHPERVQFVETVRWLTVEEGMQVFHAGAAIGYLSGGCYDVPIDDGYRDVFVGLVRERMEREVGRGGRFPLIFNRVFLKATRR